MDCRSDLVYVSLELLQISHEEDRKVLGNESTRQGLQAKNGMGRSTACSTRQGYIIRLASAKTARDKAKIRAAYRRHVRTCQRCKAPRLRPGSFVYCGSSALEVAVTLGGREYPKGTSWENGCLTIFRSYRQTYTNRGADGRSRRMV